MDSPKPSTENFIFKYTNIPTINIEIVIFRKYQLSFVLKMKEAFIYITGQIGTSYNPDGSVKQKGVELQDVISQVEKNKDAEVKTFVITSEGGSVQTGKAIARYISSIANAYTIANKFCASIATEIALAVPNERRFIVAGTEYFLHAPLMNNVQGNADELIIMADHVKEVEKEMLTMYVKSTGMDKAAIEGLMKQETSLTSEQVVELHFASKIIPSIEGAKAVEVATREVIAFFTPKNKNENQNQMKTLSEKLDALKKMVSEKLGLNVQSKAEKLKDGNTIMVEMVGTEMAIGDVITDEAGKPTPDQSYVLADETVIKTDADSKISEIIKPQPAAVAPVAEVDALKVELEAVKKERDELKTANLTIEARVDELTETVTKLAASITSKGKPSVEASAQFRTRNVATEKEKLLSDWKAKREKELKEKNEAIAQKIASK